MDAVDLLVDALSQVGFEGRSVALTSSNDSDAHYDLLLDPGGVAVRLQVKRRALVTDDVAARLLDEANETQQTDLGPSAVVVVGDRVTDAARKLLTGRGAGYLDLRGRLALRTGHVVIDAPVEPARSRTGRKDALAGRVGLEVAVALLMQPRRKIGVRQLAAELGRSASTVSEVLSSLRSDELVDDQGRVLEERLFWLVADRWPSQRTYLAAVPGAGDYRHVTGPLKLGLGSGSGSGSDEAGWALTDTLAAAIYGAPAVARSDQTLDFYVPDETVVRRATTLLGGASPHEARVAIRVAPVPVVCRHRIHDVESMSVPDNRWPLAHPLFVALDLAQDAGRGREILQGWTPSDRWSRVW